MSHSARNGLLAVVLCAALLLPACGGAPSDENTIATAVALTVEAQRPKTTPTSAATPISTITPLPTFSGTPAATQATPPTFPPPVGGDQECMQASLVDESVPDGTIMRPGQQFKKTWRIKNTSSCVWNTSYKIVFWDGNVMGGAYVYNFPQQALPGDEVEVPLMLTAPTEEGNFKSYWKLQTPGGSSFGVGADTPFWVDIVVSSDPKIEFGVTSVVYSVVREPATGCPANVWYTVYATISVNGPVSVTYNFRKSDGAFENKRTIKFTQAGSQTVSMQWSLHYGSATNERWVQLFTIAPVEQDFGKATFTYNCG